MYQGLLGWILKDRGYPLFIICLSGVFPKKASRFRGRTMKVPELVTEHPIPVDCMSYWRMLSLKVVYIVQFKAQLGRRDIIQKTLTGTCVPRVPT